MVVVDGGRPRNAVAPHMHGVLGHDGLPPLGLLARGRAEIAGYGGRFIDGEVSTARVRQGDGRIEALTPAGTLGTRRLLVATGLRDEPPDLPGLAEQWGRGVVVCPYCDGWEHRDDIVGVVATSPHSVEQAQLLRQWSERVVFFPHLSPVPDAATVDAFARRDIRVESGTVTRLRIEDGTVTGVELEGRTIAVGVVFTGPTPRPSDGLLRTLGARVLAGPMGEWVDVDGDGRTSVPGVWAVGNVVDARANVPVSLGAGSLVAGALNADLIAEDVRNA